MPAPAADLGGWRILFPTKNRIAVRSRRTQDLVMTSGTKIPVAKVPARGL
jgi:hypothetical protein